MVVVVTLNRNELDDKLTSKCWRIGTRENHNFPNVLERKIILVTCLFFYISVFSVLRLKVPILNFAVNGIRNVDIGIESKATT